MTWQMGEQKEERRVGEGGLKMELMRPEGRIGLIFFFESWTLCPIFVCGGGEGGGWEKT